MTPTLIGRLPRRHYFTTPPVRSGAIRPPHPYCNQSASRSHPARRKVFMRQPSNAVRHDARPEIGFVWGFGFPPASLFTPRHKPLIRNGLRLTLSTVAARPARDTGRSRGLPAGPCPVNQGTTATNYQMISKGEGLKSSGLGRTKFLTFHTIQSPRNRGTSLFA